MLELLVIFISPSVQEPQVPNFEDAIQQFEKIIQDADCSRESLFDQIYVRSYPLRPHSTALHTIRETHGSLGFMIATSAGGNPY